MKWCLVVLGTLVACSALAQEEESEEESGPISGKAALGYLATSGNTDSTNANASFELLYEREIWSHEFQLAAISASNSGETTAEAYTFVYDARRDFGEHSYLFATLDWERDKFSAFDQQMSESVGYGRRLVATESHALNAEIGAGARQAETRLGLDEDEGILHGALDYVWTISDTTEFSQDLTVDSGSSNTRIQTVTELRAELFGNVALVLSYRIKSNSQVTAGIEKTDRFTAISFEYAF